MSPKQKLKVRIQVWIKEFKEKFRASQELSMDRFSRDLSYRDEILVKYYHLIPRNF